MELNEQYWNQRYKDELTQWNIGHVSDPLKAYFDQLTNKSISILIPGGGNSYEAEYLLQNGFTDITVVDISEIVCDRLKEKFFERSEIKIVYANFFDWQGQYDLVVEQTFFCALDPSLREKYVNKIYDLLKPGGKLAGVMFNKELDGGPPFGGTIEEYKKLFAEKFTIAIMDDCYNSIAARAGREAFIKLIKH